MSSSSSAVGAKKAEEKQVFRLASRTELRVETKAASPVTLKLVQGTAEVFGTELMVNKSYELSRVKFAVFTWNPSGCTIELTGPTQHVYTSDETPMTRYANTSGALDQLRSRAVNMSVQPTFAALAGAHAKPAADEEEKKKTQEQQQGRLVDMGPVAMIVGPVDSGKSTLSEILLNYAVRQGWKPTFVDMDVGQNSVTTPGTICATVVEHPIGVMAQTESIDLKAPIVYYYGHASPSSNIVLYKKLTKQLAASVERRCRANASARHSGVIINTSGWVEGRGYDLIIDTAKAFRVDVVIVLGDDRLMSQLKQDAHLADVHVLKLPKSGGVVSRDANYRRSSRSLALRHYFYGRNKELYPHRKHVSFKDINVYKAAAAVSSAMLSTLPIGKKSLLDPNRVTEVKMTTANLKHHILAVLYAKNAKKMLDFNVAGFVFVEHVDEKKQMLTLLAPAPGPLPSKYLLHGSITWADSH